MEAGFYGVESIGSPMGAGVTGSRSALLDGVVKTRDANAVYTVANEYICGRLGSMVGLPTPPGTIARLNDGSWAYVMMRFGHRGIRLPPVDPRRSSSAAHGWRPALSSSTPGSRTAIGMRATWPSIPTSA